MAKLCELEDSDEDDEEYSSSVDAAVPEIKKVNPMIKTLNP